MAVANVFSGIYGAAFQICPIYLTGGVAAAFGGIGTIPISVITETAGLVIGSASGNNINQAFANFRPLPGSTLINNQVAEYPFYTQQIAANAMIQQPLNISLLMYCPANQNTTTGLKLAVMTMLQSTLQLHCQQGGTFTVLTPSQIYTDCLLTALTDVSTEETLQSQWAYQWDFVQPLITFPSQIPTLNKLTSKLSLGGTP